jgi:hypothetical protein
MYKMSYYRCVSRHTHATATGTPGRLGAALTPDSTSCSVDSKRPTGCEGKGSLTPVFSWTPWVSPLAPCRRMQSR